MSKGKVLEHQVALVTGAGSGIGAEIARAFGSAGATVVVNYRRSSEDAEAVAGEIIAAGGKALALQGDVADEQQVRRLFARVIEKYGTLDILVNNAGIQKDSSFLHMSLESWNLVIGVNLTGQFLCAREAAREFIRRGVVQERSPAAGKIICISSVHEVIPWAGHCNYAASKGGLNLLMRSVAQELAPYKIRVNSIAPGAIRTSINRDSWDTPQAEKELLRLIPYKRVGDPPDVANAAVWLASDDSDYVNGATLFVDGGMTLYPCFTGGG
jgi:glucose 1-dehydrogenase